MFKSIDFPTPMFLTPDPLLTYPARYTVPTASYGLPDGLSQWKRERFLFLADDDTRAKYPEALPRWKHLHNMLLCDYPPGTAWFTQHWWTEEFCWALIGPQERGKAPAEMLLNWGAGGTGKSEIAGFVAYQIFKAAPNDVTIIMTSTSLDALMDRMYGGVLKAFERDPDKPEGIKSIKTKPAKLLYREEGEKRSGIFCAAFEAGMDAAKVKDRLGVHNRYTFLFVDEANGVADAVWLAPANLRRGSRMFRIASLANPDSWHGQFGKDSRPQDAALTRGGIVDTILEGEGPRLADGDPRAKFASVAWKAKGDNGKSIVLHFDPTRSHSVLHPEGHKVGEREHGWMEPKDRIMAALKEISRESPILYTQVKGCPPPAGISFTVLNIRVVDEGRAQEGLDIDSPVTWLERRGCALGIDPAFQGTNYAIAIEADYGIGRTGPAADDWRWLIECTGYHCLDTNSKLDVLNSLTRWLMTIIDPEDTGSPIYSPRDIAMDATAGQYTLVEHFENQIGKGIYPVGFGEKVGIRESGRQQLQLKRTPPASAFMTVNAQDRRLATQVYKDRPTEIVMTAASFVSFGHVRSLPDVVVEQACARKLITASPIQVEPKDKAEGEDWDSLDAFAVLCVMLRERVGFDPGMIFKGSQSQIPAGTAGQPLVLRAKPKRTRKLKPNYSGVQTLGRRRPYRSS